MAKPRACGAMPGAANNEGSPQPKAIKLGPQLPYFSGLAPSNRFYDKRRSRFRKGYAGLILIFSATISVGHLADFIGFKKDNLRNTLVCIDLCW